MSPWMWRPLSKPGQAVSGEKLYCWENPKCHSSICYLLWPHNPPFCHNTIPLTIFIFTLSLSLCLSFLLISQHSSLVRPHPSPDKRNSLNLINYVYVFTCFLAFPTLTIIGSLLPPAVHFDGGCYQNGSTCERYFCRWEAWVKKALNAHFKYRGFYGWKNMLRWDPQLVNVPILNQTSPTQFLIKPSINLNRKVWGKTCCRYVTRLNQLLVNLALS